MCMSLFESFQLKFDVILYSIFVFFYYICTVYVNDASVPLARSGTITQKTGWKLSETVS